MRASASRIILTVATLGAVCTAGCTNLVEGSAGNLRAQSLRSESVVLPGDFTVAYYSHDNVAGTSIILSDVPVEQVLKGEVTNGQMLHIELLWLPKAGETPMDATATNASIRHIIVSNGRLGIYGGAGFARPSENPATSDSVEITLRDASLQLQESTEGFADLLSPAALTGTFTAKRDDRRARQLYFAVSQFVTNALGRTRYVMNEDATPREPR